MRNDSKKLEEKLVRKEAVNIVDVRQVEEVAEGKFQKRVTFH